MSTTFQISATVSPENIDLLSELFFAFDAATVTCVDAKDQPLFQVGLKEHPHWDHTTVQGLFVLDQTLNESESTRAQASRDDRTRAQASRAEQIIQTIKSDHSVFTDTVFTVTEIENKNWVEETQKNFQPQCFSGLWVCPQWEKENFIAQHPNEKVIYIEPGLAFGTGTHPTTQLCLKWLAENSIDNKIVVDYGCGSGILALAACALSAKEVYATDHDEQALESSKNNLMYNDFSVSQLHLRTTNNMHDVKADIVVANILANTLINLADPLIALLKPGAQLVLSGVLRNDVDRVVAAFQSHCHLMDVSYQEDWSVITLTK